MWESGYELFPELREGNPEALRRYLKVRVAEWPHPYLSEGRSLPRGLFGDLDVEPEVALALIPTAVELARRSQDDPEVFACALELLHQLAITSEITEMPPALSAVWGELEAIAREGGREARYQWINLREWYGR